MRDGIFVPEADIGLSRMGVADVVTIHVCFRVQSVHFHLPLSVERKAKARGGLASN